jgi:hypothetical protein
VKKALFGVLAAFCVAGCATARLDLGPRYEPANVHAVPSVPAHIRRLALLPVVFHSDEHATHVGAEILSVEFAAELRKSRAFEVINIDEAQLRAWSGRPCWRADEALPPDFFARLKAETGCDAVLFPALTVYRAYPPVAIGIEARLVSCGSLGTLWAVDEVLDAGAAPVARSARDYASAQIRGRPGEEEAILQSPTRFTRFASAALIATLPPREKILKEPQEPTITVTRGQP